MDWKYIFDKRRIVEEKITVNSFNKNIRELVGDFKRVEVDYGHNLICFSNSSYSRGNLKSNTSIEKEIWSNVILTECLCPIAQLYRFERVI